MPRTTLFLFLAMFGLCQALLYTHTKPRKLLEETFELKQLTNWFIRRFGLNFENKEATEQVEKLMKQRKSNRPENLIDFIFAIRRG